MACKDDLELARALQAEYDRETAQELDTNEDVLFDPSSFSAPNISNGAFDHHHQGPVVSANESMSIVDERWELLDPSPDVRAMFMEFNDRYFWGRLAGVEVRWSPRMTLCAGLCCYEGRGGLCSIRLSTPLLKLRPRKDLVETLLHEMIHAYLFVTENNKDHDGHGPEFCKHMKRINTTTGTNITIYHSFHDEVDVYRQHWWKCNGPCQKKPPYFGIVKRAMNRPPAPRDTWWAEHQRTCGGTYTKIKEPEGYGDKKKGNKRKKEDGGDNSEGAKGAKRQATDSSDTASLNFPGKGNVLGSETSSKPLTPLQKWIAEQRKNQNDTSLSTSKTKPPSSLGAPPSKHSSNPDESNKQANPEPTPLQKWISKISDKTKNSSSTSTSSPSVPSSSKGAGSSSKNHKNNRINNDQSGKRNSKHVRKGSGRRDALLAIFDSDSDSEDFFPSPGTKSSPTAGDPLISRSSNSNSNKTIDTLPHNSLGSTQSRNAISGTSSHSGASSGYPGLPPTRPIFDITSKSKVTSPGNQQNPVRSRTDSSKVNVTSPSKQQSPIKNAIGGAFVNVRQRSGDAGSSGNGISVTGHLNSTFGSHASIPTLDLTGSPGEHSIPIATGTVQCPVCGTSVIETNINTHLDMCLT